MKIYLKILIK